MINSKAKQLSGLISDLVHEICNQLTYPLLEVEKKDLFVLSQMLTNNQKRIILIA
ncbi:hypothetical protein [Enterococcus cecorum]|uniref:hypothetical protein n=1 Tax=Enterococcus cecorum TaxID=44008 RepID=UPI00209BD754|nr:hypothetical protein [Enterococcus cecorum]